MSDIASVNVIKTSFSHCYQDTAGKVLLSDPYFDSRATIDFGECVPGCVSLSQAKSIEYAQFGETPAKVWSPQYYTGSTFHYAVPLSMKTGLLAQHSAAGHNAATYGGDSITLQYIQDTLAREGITYNIDGSPSNLYNHENFITINPSAAFTYSNGLQIRSCSVPVNIDIRGASCTYDTGILILSSTQTNPDIYTLPKFDNNILVSHILPSAFGGYGAEGSQTAAWGDNNHHVDVYPQQRTSVQALNFGEYTKLQYKSYGSNQHKGLELNTWVLSLWKEVNETAKVFSDSFLKNEYVAESGEDTKYKSRPDKYILACQLNSPFTNNKDYSSNGPSTDYNNKTFYPFILEDSEPYLTPKLNFNHVVNVQWNWKVNYNTHSVDPELVNSFSFNHNNNYPRGLAIGDVYIDNSTGNAAISGSDDLKIGADGITIETYFRVPPETVITGDEGLNIISYQTHDGISSSSSKYIVEFRATRELYTAHTLHITPYYNNNYPDIQLKNPDNTAIAFYHTPGLWFHVAITVQSDRVYTVLNGRLVKVQDISMTSNKDNPCIISLNTQHQSFEDNLRVGSGISTGQGIEYAGFRVFRGDRYSVAGREEGDLIFTVNENRYCHSSFIDGSSNVPAVLAPYQYPEEYSGNTGGGGTEVVRITTNTESVSAQQSNSYTASIIPLSHYNTQYSNPIPLNINMSRYNTVTSARLELDGFGDGAFINFIGKEGNDTEYVGTDYYSLSSNDVTLDKDRYGNWSTPIFKSDNNGDTVDPITLLEVLEHKLNTESTKGIAYVRSLPQVDVDDTWYYSHMATLPRILNYIDCEKILKNTGYPILGNISVNTVTGPISADNSTDFAVEQPEPIQTIKFNPYSPTLANSTDFGGQVTQASLSATIGSAPDDKAVITDQSGTVQYSLSANSSVSPSALDRNIIALNVTTAGAKKGKRSQKRIKTVYGSKSDTFSIPNGKDKTQYGVSLSGIGTTVSGLSGNNLTIEVF